jgi:protein-tyrosine phosphatase
MSRIGVLFVCMGNICRSPAAEAIFRKQAHARGVLGQYSIDSCGTGGWHAQEQADSRMRASAKKRGIEISSLARQVTPSDLRDFDHILCMDDENLEHLKQMGADGRAVLMLDFHDGHDGRAVPDPYYGEGDGFELVLDLLDVACSGLLDHLQQGDSQT